MLSYVDFTWAGLFHLLMGRLLACNLKRDHDDVRIHLLFLMNSH